MNRITFTKTIIAAMIMMMTGCSGARRETSPILQGVSEPTVKKTILALQEKYPDSDADRLRRGVAQAGALWRAEDGSEQDFSDFVLEHFAGSEQARTDLFLSLSRLMENLNESYDLLTVNILKPTQLMGPDEPTDVDWIMSGFNPAAHLTDDLFANKVAFITILNFPFYTLEEKNSLGVEWSRLGWAEARLGDLFTSRVPAGVLANLSQAYADAENYIADYNICMDRLRTEDGRQLFPDSMLLLSHWNLRDEIKAHYADSLQPNPCQEMIYDVMLRIVRQEIPKAVINNPEALWYPVSNRVENASDEPETDRRYQMILNIFHAMQQQDEYCPNMPTAIIRNFEGDIEIPAAQVDSLFRQLLGSEQVKTVAAEIRSRLGRDLRPYDIWYDGFKARSVINEKQLDRQTEALYPNAEAYRQHIPDMLCQLGFNKTLAEDIASHIVVEAARGSGHAWPCVGRNEPARLRTRIPSSGMNYKGFNIAVHEMGHNVEEVTSLYYIDHYMLRGIPNTGFTEASAFLFQHRDLQLLGYGKQTLDREAVLDAFWGMYEIMGVSLVDMRMWQWLYAHPWAGAEHLRDATLAIAAEVWNDYFEPVLGEHDCPLLAIYSHMVNSPMYLPNYPIGHIVQFQLEQFFADKTDRQWAEQYQRCYRLGRLTPEEWLRQATGSTLSVEPILKQVSN
ncbi:MAG: hypothetical protein J6Y76_02565 [Paludibacteraceae bacterium]|nr:hypothetical protein [Paludibacteraceae bacterium]